MKVQKELLIYNQDVIFFTNKEGELTCSKKMIAILISLAQILAHNIT